MVFSNYNNYLNDCIFDDSVKTVDQERKLRLEQLADKFWLRDGSIDEDMFDESSDEEHEEQEEISHHNHRRSSLTRKSKSVLWYKYTLTRHVDDNITRNSHENREINKKQTLK